MVRASLTSESIYRTRIVLLPSDIDSEWTRPALMSCATAEKSLLVVDSPLFTTRNQIAITATISTSQMVPLRNRLRSPMCCGPPAAIANERGGQTRSRHESKLYHSFMLIRERRRDREPQ